ncbi:AAC(3) family N-acetyltransferase [Kribbella sandramycini]|uniref:Aminoglycoside N(3)-acetyltransferase n=1 Tax=Kribbella sandramycini TaxID=60450 RepID=A0A7Y4L4G4_9ACTN|nr:AAC(3) family N-acetyltransferase [Kribbella sandramycini]MBB6571536.1 aminoglycoside 3-N-acetyltransferase [Kribbella sandramycini]NOL44185.1 AAC(3) family N-acetyltransferase [Kribbella sandramycini]
MVTRAEIADGLRQLGLDRSARVIVHTSLRSFGQVDGGAEAVCQALIDTCGTVLMPGGTWDSTVVAAPPGTVRPNNAFRPAADWATFDESVRRASAYRPELPVDRWLGRVPDVMRAVFAPPRTTHPLFGYQAVGERAEEVLAAQRIDWPLGPIEALDGEVLLLGVGHTSNTTIHLAEQRLGMSRFYRYAKTGDGVWSEFPNLPGESHRFDAIEPSLRSATKEVRIGECRARLVPIATVLAVTTRLVLDDPGALLCSDDPECRCAAALAQRLAQL